MGFSKTESVVFSNGKEKGRRETEFGRYSVQMPGYFATGPQLRLVFRET